MGIRSSPCSLQIWVLEYLLCSPTNSRGYPKLEDDAAAPTDAPTRFPGRLRPSFIQEGGRSHPRLRRHPVADPHLVHTEVNGEAP